MKRRTQLALGIALGMFAVFSAAAEWGGHVVATEAASEQGDPQAQTDLAVSYENAEGVPKDFQKAHALYCRAAKQGYAEAQFRLGWVYANGRGVRRDDGVAAALFAMAAEQGHEYAGKLLRYVRRRPDAELPSCLLPDPPVRISIAIEETHPVMQERSENEQNEQIEQIEQIEQLVRRLAPQYAVDPQLALAVVSVESAFNPTAVSPKNARGLMQLIPETAERFGVKKVFSPAENIKGGLAYLRWLLAFFKGEVRLVAAAYNAGERAVEKYRGIPPYPETQDYVRKITRLYKSANHPYEVGIVEPSPIMSRIKRTRG